MGYHIGEFKNGQIEGKGKVINENGNVEFEGDFINGKLNGKGINYHENGKIK